MITNITWIDNVRSVLAVLISSPFNVCGRLTPGIPRRPAPLLLMTSLVLAVGCMPLLGAVQCEELLVAAAFDILHPILGEAVPVKT